MSSPSTSSVWFITGASSGFGLALARHALAAGHLVIGTLRSRAKSAQAVAAIEDAGGRVMELDTSWAWERTARVAAAAEQVCGRIDVLVNNAAYALLGAMEDVGEDEFEAQLKTNVFGPLGLIKAVLPGMRERRSGTIINVSSVAGVNGLPSSGAYAASKFALEGYTESLASEVASFNVRVLLVSPGAFRTNFMAALKTTKKPLDAAYRDGPVDVTLKRLLNLHGMQKGDPEKAVRVIVEVVDCSSEKARAVKEGGLLRLPLGTDSLDRFNSKIGSLTNDVAACKEWAESTNFEN